MNRQQHNDYNDEALYQEIMAELDSGAAEYDRLMASGEAPAKKASSLPSRNKKETGAVKWYAAAAAVAGLLIVSTMMFFERQDTAKQTAATVPASEGMHLAEKKASVPHMENTDSDIYKLTARLAGRQKERPKRKLQASPSTPYIYTAMLPEVEFCPEGNDAIRSNAVSSSKVRLPQVSKERSFNLVCKVTLPEIIACADSTIYQSTTEMMVACDEIEYNDNPFKNVSL